MSSTPSNDLTAILQAARAGDREADAQLWDLVYNDLRRLAHSRMAQLPPQTLSPTALVHEAYLRVVGKRDLQFEDRKQLFLLAAQAMRDILVERARSKAGPKRGGDRTRVELDETSGAVEPPLLDVLALNEALTELEKEDPLKAQIVQLRYFAGMTAAETAQVLEVSERSLYRHWRVTEAWLRTRLGVAKAD
jgi:RNA polymerase sigma factor (TIGR02999 family)